MSTNYPAFDRITSDPRQLGGKPCIRGTRLAVHRVLEALAQNPSWDELLADYPSLEPEDVGQVLRYAAAAVDGEVMGLKSAG